MTLPVSTYGSDPTMESSSSAVYWGPIIAGAMAAAVLTALLMLVGGGLGLSMVSPFSGDGADLATIGIGAGIWMIVVQWLSSGVGGYLTGRLRTKWSGIHTDEVYFRDTAHGFLAWALATLLMLGMAGSTASGILRAGADAVGTATGVAASGAAMAGTAAGEADGSGQTDPIGYFTDLMMRPADPARASAGDVTASNREVGRILLHAAAAGELPADDRIYLDRVVAARTGLSEADAKARIDAVLKQADAARNQAMEAAETARKGTATAALLGALALFIGAFIAGAAAALGGRQRDEDESLRA